MKKLNLSPATIKKASISALAMLPMCVTAFATGTQPTFDLAATMTTAVSTIVGDLLAMIAAVLPITVTLLAASIGVAYGIRFIKKIVNKT